MLFDKHCQWLSDKHFFRTLLKIFICVWIGFEWWTQFSAFINLKTFFFLGHHFLWLFQSIWCFLFVVLTCYAILSLSMFNDCLQLTICFFVFFRFWWWLEEYGKQFLFLLDMDWKNLIVQEWEQDVWTHFSQEEFGFGVFCFMQVNTTNCWTQFSLCWDVVLWHFFMSIIILWLLQFVWLLWDHVCRFHWLVSSQMPPFTHLCITTSGNKHLERVFGGRSIWQQLKLCNSFWIRFQCYLLDLFVLTFSISSLQLWDCGGWLSSCWFRSFFCSGTFIERHTKRKKSQLQSHFTLPLHLITNTSRSFSVDYYKIIKQHHNHISIKQITISNYSQVLKFNSNVNFVRQMKQDEGCFRFSEVYLKWVLFEYHKQWNEVEWNEIRQERWCKRRENQISEFKYKIITFLVFRFVRIFKFLFEILKFWIGIGLYFV